MLAASAPANSAFDWTGTDGVVTIPAGVAAEVLDEDIAAVEALTSIVQADKTSQIVFKNTTPLTLAASITGPGGGNTGCHNVVMDAASQVTFNGNLHFTGANTFFTLGNCTINAEIGGDTNYYYVYARSGCTVVYSSTAKIIRRYQGYFRGQGTHRFASKIPNDNSQTFACMNFENATLVLDADNIINFPCMDGGATSNSRFDLNGHSISLKSIRGGMKTAADTPYRTEVTSAEQATLTFNMTTKEAYYDYGQESSVFYTGALTVNFANGSAFTNRLMNGISTTTGDLNISGGTLAFAGNAQWVGPTVNVTGGRLLASAGLGSLSTGTDLSVSGTGVVEVPAGSTLRVRSLTVDGVEVLRNASRAVASLAADYPGRFVGGGTINALQPFIYVDDASGDDDNDGRSAVGAFKTIKHALECCDPGDTILVAPGVYGDEPGDEVMGVAGDWSRIVIPEAVTVRATGAATNTFILGKTATEPLVDSKGNALSGTDSARCAYLNANSRIEGFTLTGGCATWNGTTAKTGGGVYAANRTDCRIVGCIISNCYAATTASAGQSGSYLRCRISGNNKSGTNYGYGLRDARAYNCFFVGQTDAESGCYDTFYCTFYSANGGDSRQSHNGYGPVRGCVFMSGSAPGLADNAKLYNTICVKLPTSPASIVVDETCAQRAWSEIAIANTGAPTADSAAVDFGETWESYLARMLAAGWTEEESSVDFAGNPRCRGAKLDAGCREYDENSETSIDKLYVDDLTGNDANDGRNVHRAKKTIKAALEAAAFGYTVFVAEGVYGDEPGDEVMGTEGNWSRIVIPDGVTVKATGRCEDTIILGRKATEVLSGGGCGTDSARCVYLNASSHIEGFTLTGGYSTQTESTTKDGGGFCSQNSSQGIVVNCVVSNNVASNTGGSGFGGRCFGCRFYDNTAVTSYGKGLRYSNAYNCILKDSNGINGMVSVCYALVNCTVVNPGASGHATMHAFSASDVINCVFVTDAKPEAISNKTYRACLFTTAPAAAANVDEASRVVTAAELALDGWGVPSAKTSSAVGAGSYEAYAAAMASHGKYINLDATGRPRVSNGTLDVGGAEYDWRGEYARDLGSTRWLKVDAAASNVVETAAGTVRLVGGSSIELAFTIANVNGEPFAYVPFEKSGAGTLTATLDGEPVEPVGGMFVSPATAAKRTLVLSFEGDGHVDFTKMMRASGFVLIVQ